MARNPILAAAVLVPGLLAQAVSEQSLAKERALGASLADDIKRRRPTVTDETLQGYLDSILAEAGERARCPHPATVAILASASPATEAVALPGGYLFVSLGMIANANSGRDIARILAHGLAHVTARHGIRQGATGSGALIFMGGWNIEEEGGTLVPLAFRQQRKRFEAEADSLAANWLTATTGLDRFDQARARARALLTEKPPVRRGAR